MVVILLLVFDDFDGDRFASFVVDTADDTTESTFANDFLNFVSKSNLITLVKSVVSLVVIEAVIDESL